MSNEKMSADDVLANLDAAIDTQVGKFVKLNGPVARELRYEFAALIAERDAFRAALEEIVKNNPWKVSASGRIARAAIDFASADASHAGS